MHAAAERLAVSKYVLYEYLLLVAVAMLAATHHARCHLLGLLLSAALLFTFVLRAQAERIQT